MVTNKTVQRSVKVMKLYANLKHQEVEFPSSGEVVVTMEGRECVVDCRGKFFDFGWLMWPHYEFDNMVRYMTGKFMELGFYAHNVGEGNCYGEGQVIAYKRCQEMTNLIKQFKSLYKLKAGSFPSLDFYGIKAEILKVGTFKLQVQFTNGHYVAGSYTHDYTAASAYLEVLNKVMAPMSFTWTHYDSSNSHSYFFETKYAVGKVKFKHN